MKNDVRLYKNNGGWSLFCTDDEVGTVFDMPKDYFVTDVCYGDHSCLYIVNAAGSPPVVTGLTAVYGRPAFCCCNGQRYVLKKKIKNS